MRKGRESDCVVLHTFFSEVLESHSLRLKINFKSTSTLVLPVFFFSLSFFF